MHTDTLTDRVIAVDYGTSLQAMIATGTYDRTNPNITPDKFPIVGTGTKRFRAKLFIFDRDISSEDAISAMKAENFTPADHVHGLAYGAAYPEDQGRPIACLGSSALVKDHYNKDHRSVVCLLRLDAERRLDLRWDGGQWSYTWRFLAVQEVSGT